MGRKKLSQINDANNHLEYAQRCFKQGNYVHTFEFADKSIACYQNEDAYNLKIQTHLK